MSLTTKSLIVCLFVVAVAGCGEAENQPGTVVGSPDDPVVLVADDDPEMAAAVQKARDTVDDFITALESGSATASDFAVKKEFKQGESSEFMWLSELSYGDGVFSGTLNNDPGIVTNVKIGETFTVARGEIQDWIYFEGEEMKGGYSVRILMERSQK